jgi:KDEL-tailed cysteine endopeptidase
MNLLKNKAEAYENEYKYTAKDGSCKSVQGHAKVSGVNSVRAQSGSALKAAISKGPVSVTVDASPTAFMQYKTGIVNRNCATALNHAITAVGWGTASG